MDDIASGVQGLRIAFVNVFAVTHPDGSWTLIDAALPFTATIIQHWAKQVSEAPPNAIILTHGHFDHVSAARELADQWNVCVYAHPLEAPYLKGIKEYPAPNFAAGGGTMSWLSPLYPRGPLDLGGRLRLLPLSDSSDSPEMPGWQILDDGDFRELPVRRSGTLIAEVRAAGAYSLAVSHARVPPPSGSKRQAVRRNALQNSSPA